jgi:hypothetical protein
LHDFAKNTRNSLFYSLRPPAGFFYLKPGASQSFVPTLFKPNSKMFLPSVVAARRLKSLAFANQRLVARHSLPLRIFDWPTVSPRATAWNNANFLCDSGKSYEDNLLTLIRKLFTRARLDSKTREFERVKRKITLKIKVLFTRGRNQPPSSPAYPRLIVKNKY